MFGRCSTTTPSAAIAANAITGHGSPSPTAISGRESAARIDASEAYRKSTKTTIQTAARSPPTAGATPRNAPLLRSPPSTV
jgi:hypothetical protein